MSNSATLWTVATRLPCPSLPPGLYSNSCPLSLWGQPTISSSLIPFSSCLQSFPASGSFLMGRFLSGGQSIEASALASVLPVTIQGWFHLGLTNLISLQSKGLSSLLQHYGSKASVLGCSAFFIVQLSYLYMTTEKTIKLITGGITVHDLSMYPVLYYVPYMYFQTKCSQNPWVDRHDYPTLILIEETEAWRN